MGQGPSWKNSILKALEHRRSLFQTPQHNVFRLLHGEGDDLEGLYADLYAGHLRLEAHRSAWAKDWEGLQKLLTQEIPSLQSVTAVVRDARGKADSMKVLAGHPPKTVVGIENDCRFSLRLNEADALGTGLFPDMRLVRQRVKERAAGSRVLNLFAHAGGFGVAAAVGGAERVDHVDAARKCAPWAALNLALNGINPRRHRFLVEDAIKTLKKAARRGHQYDLILCDPPVTALAPNGKRWTTRDHIPFYGAQLALALKPKGSFVFSTNDRNLSLDVLHQGIQQGLRESGRTLKSIEELPLGRDYPDRKSNPRLRPMRGVWVSLND